MQRQPNNLLKTKTTVGVGFATVLFLVATNNGCMAGENGGEKTIARHASFEDFRKGACRAFPRSAAQRVRRAGPKRNFQILDPLEFLAAFTQYVLPKGAHLIRYYGWYSNKARGLRRQGGRSRRRGTADRSLGRRRRAGSGSQPGQPDLGDAHQADVRDGPAGLPSFGKFPCEAPNAVRRAGWGWGGRWRPWPPPSPQPLVSPGFPA